MPCRSCSRDVPVEDTGSFRNDCETYLGGLSAVFADPSAMSVITQLINESAREPDLALALRSHIVAPRRVRCSTSSGGR